MKCYKVLIVNFLLILSIMNCNGMFEAILTAIEPLIKDSSIFNIDNIKLTRFNRTTFVINGSAELFVDSIEDFDALCTLYKKGGNEYKLLPYKIGPERICRLLDEQKKFYEQFYPFTKNFPPIDTCDFKKETYYVLNFLPDLSKVPPVFQSGDYLGECLVHRGDELVQGVKIYSQLYNIMSGK